MGSKLSIAPISSTAGDCDEASQAGDKDEFKKDLKSLGAPHVITPTPLLSLLRLLNRLWVIIIKT